MEITLEDIKARLGLELMPSLQLGARSFEAMSDISENSFVAQAKLLEFPAHLESRTVENARLCENYEPSLQVRGCVEAVRLALLVRARELDECVREILLQVIPFADAEDFPETFTFSLLDDSGKVLNEAKPKGNDSFGFRLSVEMGERFGVRIAFGQTEYFEYFVG